MLWREIFSLFDSAASGWIEDNAMRLSAALAYYSIFSLAPLLVIGISIAGFVFGDAAARGQVAEQMRQFAGDPAAEAIQALLQGASQRTASLSATFVGLLFLLFGASGVFSELKDALNTIWGVAIKPGKPLLTLIRERLISFTIVLSLGFLLLVSLVLSATLALLGRSMRSLLACPAALWQVVDIFVSFAVATFLFAMIFKMLPNVKLRWRDVGLGACLTGFLFTMGKFLIGFYLGTTGMVSYYGAASSAIVLLLWVYYSACILFFGAEFTKSWVEKFGSGILPDKRAVFRFHASQPAKVPPPAL